MLLAEISEFSTAIDVGFVTDHWKCHDSFVTMETDSPLVQLLVVIGNLAKQLGKIAIQDIKGEFNIQFLVDRPFNNIVRDLFQLKVPPPPPQFFNSTQVSVIHKNKSQNLCTTCTIYRCTLHHKLSSLLHTCIYIYMYMCVYICTYTCVC